MNNMLRKKRHPLVFLANVCIFALVIIFHTSEIADISIYNASPMLILPLLTAFSFFADLKQCVIAGLICGAFIDSVSQGAYCFNTIVLMLLSVFVYLAANNLFNKNIRAAMVLSLITAAIYYILLWLFFYCIGAGMQNNLGFLLKYALPSAVYSAVFIFPFYYLYRYFKNRKNIK